MTLLVVSYSARASQGLSTSKPRKHMHACIRGDTIKWLYRFFCKHLPPQASWCLVDLSDDPRFLPRCIKLGKSRLAHYLISTSWFQVGKQPVENWLNQSYWTGSSWTKHPFSSKKILYFPHLIFLNLALYPLWTVFKFSCPFVSAGLNGAVFGSLT